MAIYNYNNNIDFSDDNLFGNSNQSISDKLVSFTDDLLLNLKPFENKNDSVHNLGKRSRKEYTDALANVKQLKLNFLSGAYSGNEMQYMKDLWTLYKSIGGTKESFKEYFSDFLPKESPTQARINNLKNTRGWSPVTALDLGLNSELSNYLTNSKTNLMQDADGHIFALNEDYSALKPLDYFNLDWHTEGNKNSPYNQYMITDASGRVYHGNYGELSTDSPIYNDVTNLRNNKVNSRSNLFLIFNDFDPNLNYTEDKLVSDFVREMLNSDNLRHSLKNFVDVSPLFQGNKKVIAINPNGDKFSTDNLKDGTIQFNPETVFYVLDNNGEIRSVKWGQANRENYLGKYNPNGWGETDNHQVANLLKGIDFGDMVSSITPDQIKGDHKEWATRMLDILSKSSLQRSVDDIRELEKYNGLKDKSNVLSYIGALLKEGNLELDASYKKKWFNLTKKYQTNNLQTTSAITEDLQDLKLIDEAAKAGYSNVTNYLENLRKGFTTTEWMRLGALAADIASLGASFAPGAGTIASGILGAGASGTDFAADIMQDGFLWKDLGNLGINLGLDVVGLLPGGKSLKITKNAVKVISRTLPLLAGIWSAVADGDKYIAVANKLVSGDPKEMTALDWQTLGRGLMLVTGSVRTGKATYGAYKSGYNTAKEGVKKVYNTVAEPFRHNKEVRERAKRTGAFRKGEGYLPLTTKESANKQGRNSDPFMVEEKQGGKLDRFGEYLKSHK